MWWWRSFSITLHTMFHFIKWKTKNRNAKQIEMIFGHGIIYVLLNVILNGPVYDDRHSWYSVSDYTRPLSAHNAPDSLIAMNFFSLSFIHTVHWYIHKARTYNINSNLFIVIIYFSTSNVSMMNDERFLLQSKSSMKLS